MVWVEITSTASAGLGVPQLVIILVRGEMIPLDCWTLIVDFLSLRADPDEFLVRMDVVFQVWPLVLERLMTHERAAARSTCVHKQAVQFQTYGGRSHIGVFA